MSMKVNRSPSVNKHFVSQHACFGVIFLVMIIIPDKTSRVRRLTAMEKQINLKLIFEEKFEGVKEQRRATKRIRQRRSTYVDEV